MPNTTCGHRRFNPGLLALACLLPGAGSALAQESNPYYVGVRQSFTHDSNVYRTSENQVSQTISSTGLVAGLDQKLSRQRLFADLSADVNRYSSQDSLNNKSYALNAGLDWETIEFLSGTLRYNTRNSLASVLNADGSTLIGDQVTNQFNASARYGFTSYLAFDAGYEYRHLRYKNPLLENRNYSQNTVNGGLRWVVGPTLTLGLGVRSGKGEAPQFQTTPPYADELRRRDTDLTAIWTPSAASTVSARVSATKETHSLASNAEVSETTGMLSWDYRPTGRLGLNASISRDTGTETTFVVAPSSSTDALKVDNSRLSTALSLQARYALTAKTSLNTSAQQRRGTLADSTQEKINNYTLGVAYAATRAISLGCSVARESRSVPARSYDVTATSCFGELTLR